MVTRLRGFFPQSGLTRHWTVGGRDVMWDDHR